MSDHWHHVAADEVAKLLEVDPQRGLDHLAVAERSARFGPNVLTRTTGHGAVVRFLLQFHQPLIYILIAASLITISLGEWVDACVILGVVLVNAIVGYVQESRALDAIAALSKSLPSDATVLRGGLKQRIAASELVPGDLVFLQSGDRIPADLRLLKLRELRIDESPLTGESLPVTKVVAMLDQKTPLADRKNMAYGSMLATNGTGSGLVVAIGDKTEIGRLAALVRTTEVLETPLTRRISKFSKILLIAILTLAGVTFGVGLLRGQPWFEMFLAAVALAVGGIPEGLPAAVTVTLALGVSRMARRHAVVRRLPAVEALGSATIVCSDKTGTLTRNEMTVREVFAGGERFELTGVGYEPAGEVVGPGEDTPGDALRACLRIGMLCNDTQLRRTDSGWQVEGDPTEAALTVAAGKAGLTASELEAELPRVDVIPFESEHQYMATLHRATPDGPGLALLKGSVDKLLPRCSTALDSNGLSTAVDAESIIAAQEEMAAKGLRVLLFAQKSHPAGAASLDDADLVSGLTFVGLQDMIDPPRAEAVRAVETCRRAGIRVAMITGDHAGTALAVARQLGLVTGEQQGGSPVLSGRELAELSDAQLAERVATTNVFARVSPDHKLRLVKAFQSQDHIVAMTGDGVNDAPALKRANIGIAMGRSGTETARDASDIVLADDNFASIEAAIEEGRGVFDNLMKFIVWTLPTNGGESLAIVLAIFFGVALPILPVQILWINMTTAGFLGLSLAFEPKERDLMMRPPRSPAEPLLSRALVMRCGLVSLLLCGVAFTLFEWELGTGHSASYARTVAATAFVIGELFYLFNCRSLERSAFAVGLFSNPWVWGGVATMLLAQAGFVYLPFMQRLFHTTAIDIGSWAAIIASGALIFAIVGLEKLVRRLAARRRPLES